MSRNFLPLLPNLPRMVSQELVEMLRCLDDRSPLRLADATLLERVNRGIADGTLKNRGGRPLEQPLDACLIRQDGKLAYPIVDDIPIMLADEAFEVGD